MNIIILGAGEIGRHMALSLSNDDHSTVVIEHDESVAQELEEHLDARVMCADGASAEVLIEAGAAGCDLFLALTSSNTINLVACRVAKKLGANKTICRVHPEFNVSSGFLISARNLRSTISFRAKIWRRSSWRSSSAIQMRLWSRKSRVGGWSCSR